MNNPLANISKNHLSYDEPVTDKQSSYYVNTQYWSHSTITYLVKMEFEYEMSGLELYFEILPLGNNVIFVTAFVILGTNHPFYEGKENGFPNEGISKI